MSEIANRIIASNPKLATMAKKNAKLKWIIMREYQRQVRDRIALIESFLATVSSNMDVDTIIELCDALHMTRANEVDRILVAFRPPDSLFDMSKAAMSHFHRLLKPQIGNKTMLIDGVEAIIYR